MRIHCAPQLITKGALAPLIDNEFPMVAGAHRRLETSGHVGKIVLEVI